MPFSWLQKSGKFSRKLLARVKKHEVLPPWWFCREGSGSRMAHKICSSRCACRGRRLHRRRQRGKSCSPCFSLLLMRGSGRTTPHRLLLLSPSSLGSAGCWARPWRLLSPSPLSPTPPPPSPPLSRNGGAPLFCFLRWLSLHLSASSERRFLIRISPL